MFNHSEFDGFLAAVGQDVVWRRAYACPCVNPTSGHARVGCKHCKGKGRLWQPGLDARTGVSGREAQQQWVQFGQPSLGDVVVTVPSDSPLYEIGPSDRVLFKNKTEPFSLNIVKGVNERINFSIVSLEKVLYIDGNDAMVDAPLPVVQSNGVLNWSGVEIPDGVTFSLAGRRNPEYFCMKDTPFDRPHQGGAKLPRRVVLRRFELYANQ